MGERDPVCHLRSRHVIPLLAYVVLPGSFVLSVFDSAKFSSSCAYSPTSKEKQNPPRRFSDRFVFLKVPKDKYDILYKISGS